MKKIIFCKNAQSKKGFKKSLLQINDPRDLSWRHLKEKNQLFLSYEYQKMYTPAPKITRLSQIAANRKWESMKNINFCENAKKKDSKIHTTKTNDRRDFWFALMKEKNQFFHGYEYQKMYTPSPKTALLSKIAKN